MLRIAVLSFRITVMYIVLLGCNRKISEQRHMECKLQTPIGSGMYWMVMEKVTKVIYFYFSSASRKAGIQLSFYSSLCPALVQLVARNRFSWKKCYLSGIWIAFIFHCCICEFHKSWYFQFSPIWYVQSHPKSHCVRCTLGTYSTF